MIEKLFHCSVICQTGPVIFVDSLLFIVLVNYLQCSYSVELRGGHVEPAAEIAAHVCLTRGNAIAPLKITCL